MESRMREIRTYGLTRGKPHRHAPQRLRPKVEIARASRRAYLCFGGNLAEGNPKDAQAGAQRRGVGLYSTITHP